MVLQRRFVTEQLKRFRLKSQPALISGPTKLHGRAVAQDFSNALHHLGRVVPNSNHAVCAGFGGMQQHPLERIAARLLAELREEPYIPADQRLQAGPNAAKNRPRADNNSADDPQASAYA